MNKDTTNLPSVRHELSLRSGQGQRKWPLWDSWLLLVENYSNCTLWRGLKHICHSEYLTLVRALTKWTTRTKKEQHKPKHSSRIFEFGQYLCPTISLCILGLELYKLKVYLTKPAGVSATKRTYFSPFTKDSRALSPLAIIPIIGTLRCTLFKWKHTSEEKNGDSSGVICVPHHHCPTFV